MAVVGDLNLKRAAPAKIAFEVLLFSDFFFISLDSTSRPLLITDVRSRV